MKVFLLAAVLVVAVLAKPQAPKTRIGFYEPSPRVINGTDAKEGEFSHQISLWFYLLGIFGQHICGGSIVSPTWIVTAGHCITGIPNFGTLGIIAGTSNLDVSTSERQEISVAQAISHPNFTGDVGPNDVAVARLQTPLKLGPSVQPVKVPTPGTEFTGKAVVSGWGAINGAGDQLPTQLKKSELPILTHTECNDAIVEALKESGEANPLDETSNICTGPLDGGLGACSGDSGGPLTQNGVLVGIVSWGFVPCGSIGAPSVFTRTSTFHPYIKGYVTDLPE